MVGAGALGSAAAIYLAAAGVGTIGLIDADTVDLSNLHRQILHMDRDAGRPKTQSGRRHLEDLNPDVRVVEHRLYLSAPNALDILSSYDLVVNGSDNFPTRYLLSDACVLLGKPLVDASILMFEGQATAYVPGQGCYRCLYPAPPPPGSVPSCAEAGVLGALAGQMGSLQALEAIKLLLGIGQSLAGRLLTYDALYGEWRVFKYRRRPTCPARGHTAGARSIPAGQINDRLAEIDRERTTVLVCNVGELSGMVVDVLREAGYGHVYNLAGGIAAWQNHSLPLQRPAD